MNIGIISPQIYPCNIGGMELYNYNFILELALRDHQIYLFTNCKTNLNNKNIKNITLNQRLLLHPDYSVFLDLILKIILFKKKIDVLIFPYTSNSKLAYYSNLIHNIFKIPYIIHIHGGGLYPWKHEFLQKPFFENSDAIIAVSERIKTEYESRVTKKITFIPPIIPFKFSNITKKDLRKKYNFNSKDKLILYIGSIKKIKGVEILLNAFFKLNKEYIKKTNLKLIFVGDGELKESLIRKTHEMKFTNYIIFTGYIPHDTICEFYKLSDIYVIPSVFEGTPLSLLEAMYNGLSVIGNDVEGIKNIINNNNGLLFKKNDSDDLKDKIKLLLENEKIAESLGKVAKKYMEIYNFEKTLNKHIKIIENVI